MNIRISVDHLLVLEQLKTSDAPALFQLIEANRIHLSTYLPWVKHTQKEQDTLNFIQSVDYNSIYEPQFPLKILWQNKIVGMCGFNRGEEPKQYLEIGYWLAKDFQGKGIVSKAIAAQIVFLKNNTNVKKVGIKCAFDNERSAAIPRRLGFQERPSLNNHRVFELSL